MKKLVLVLGMVALTFTSCGDVLNGDCNCGLITSDRASDYSVVIRNNCSDNSKRFRLTPGDWMNAYVGYDYCITNTQGW